MASTAAFPALSVPAADDTMEMSSPGPANRYLDSDIEIDFDEPYDGAQNGEDDQMIEDEEQPRPGTAADDIMQDDDQPLTAASTEEIMHDDPVTEADPMHDEDDDLIDYEDEAYVYNQTVNLTEPTHSTAGDEAQAPTDILTEQAGPSDVHVTAIEAVVAKDDGKDSVVDKPASSPISKGTQPSKPVEESAELQEPVIPKSEDSLPTKLDTGNSTPNAMKSEDDPKSSSATVNKEAETEKPSSPELPPINATAKEPVGVRVDSENIPSTVSAAIDIHSIALTVTWHENVEIPLFKSQAQPNGLLENESILGASLADFLLACRERLASQLDISVGQDEDLVLMFDSLYLSLHEDCHSCRSTNLSDLLELYAKLHQNDGTEDIPKFKLRLKAVSKFTSQIDFLKESAAQGQGVSVLEAMLESEMARDGGDGFFGDDDHENEFVEGDDAADEQEYYEEQDAGNEHAQHDAQRDVDDQDNGVQHHEETTEQFELEDHEENITAATAGDEDDTADLQVGQEQATGEAEIPSQATDQLQQETGELDAAENTDIVRTFTANDLAGEYPNEDDLVDWDDEYLTAEGVDTQTAPKQDMASTAAAESHTQNDQKANAVSETKSGPENTESFNAGSDGAKEPPSAEDGFANIEDEEELIDYSDDDYEHGEDDSAKAPGQIIDNNVDDEFEIDFDADPVDEAALNGSHTVDNEDDERFHTAYDLFEDGDAEEHDTSNQDFQGEGNGVGDVDNHVSPNQATHDEDTINFDDDDEEVDPTSQTTQDIQPPKAPATKRSFDQLGGNEESPTDSAKKARAA